MFEAELPKKEKKLEKKKFIQLIIFDAFTGSAFYSPIFFYIHLCHPGLNFLFSQPKEHLKGDLSFKPSAPAFLLVRQGF